VRRKEEQQGPRDAGTKHIQQTEKIGRGWPATSSSKGERKNEAVKEKSEEVEGGGGIAKCPKDHRSFTDQQEIANNRAAEGKE